MSKGLRISLIIIVVVVSAAALLLAGFSLARAAWGTSGGWPAGMMGGYGPGASDRGPYGLPGSGMMGYGMMSGGMMGSGMLGATSLLGVEPLTLEEAEDALSDYLTSLGDQDLRQGEIMIFDNHAYAQIVEESTGIGAMEVLVDPVTLAVYPEHGPNMMWNLKYSPMAGFGMMGGMMGQFGSRSPGFGLGRLDPSAEMPVTAAEAVEAAQDYLDRYLPGTEADERADPFYGYYTLHVLRSGETVGMLSVNGYSAEVFLHTWHGDFVEMIEAE